MKGLNCLEIPLNPVETLVTFIIGSVVSDGSINEKDYLYIYPSLVKAFGNDFDFISAKQAKDVKILNFSIGNFFTYVFLLIGIVFAVLAVFGKLGKIAALWLSATGYVEILNHDVHVHTKSQVFTYRGTLKETEAKLYLISIAATCVAGFAKKLNAE